MILQISAFSIFFFDLSTSSGNMRDRKKGKIIFDFYVYHSHFQKRAVKFDGLVSHDFKNFLRLEWECEVHVIDNHTEVILFKVRVGMGSTYYQQPYRSYPF